MRRFVLSLMLPLVSLAACSVLDPAIETPKAPPPSDSEVRAGLIADGEAIADENCTLCHAVGAKGDSPRYDAPPLRYVLADRDVEALSDDFREGIHVGADDMPDFDFGPLGTDALIAYIQSIQTEPES